MTLPLVPPPLRAQIEALLRYENTLKPGERTVTYLARQPGKERK